MPEKVMLLHGLAESSSAMWPIAMWLAQNGYQPIALDYPSTLYPIEQLTHEYLAPAVRAQNSREILHFVTHSLGSALLRAYLEKNRIPSMGRVVMLAPGHHGSEVMEFYTENPVIRACLGPAARQCGIGRNCFACHLEDIIDYELGIIAGCLPLNPLSLLIAAWPHDGINRVSSTKIQGMKDHVVIAASHEFITLHPSAIYETNYFIKYGRFRQSVTAPPQTVETTPF